MRGTLFRLRYRFRAWRFKWRERHENKVIARQQQQITATQKAWESDLARLEAEKKAIREDAESQRREMERQIAMLTKDVAHLTASLDRELERVAYETAKFSRGVAEYQDLPGKIVT